VVLVEIKCVAVVSLMMVSVYVDLMYLGLFACLAPTHASFSARHALLDGLRRCVNPAIIEVVVQNGELLLVE